MLILAKILEFGSEPFLRKVRAQFTKSLNGYVDVGDLRHYIRLPSIENNGSATIGNFALALEETRK